MLCWCYRSVYSNHRDLTQLNESFGTSTFLYLIFSISIFTCRLIHVGNLARFLFFYISFFLFLFSALPRPVFIFCTRSGFYLVFTYLYHYCYYYVQLAMILSILVRQHDSQTLSMYNHYDKSILATTHISYYILSSLFFFHFN